MPNPAVSRSVEETSQKRRRYAGRCRFRAWLLSSIASLAFLWDVAYAQAPSEYQVKAAFLYNFAKFIEWPPASFPNQSAAFQICVFGPDPFGGELQDITRNKMVNGHQFQVSQVEDLERARTCQILFVSSSEKTPVKQILDGLHGSSVLTVGDRQGFAERGGMINFLLEDDRVRFEVNQKAAEEAGLKLSSQLLSVAKRTKT